MSEVLPPGWAVVPLGSVAHVQLGKMLSAAAKTGQGTRPYLRNINVRWHRIDVDDVFTMDFNEREVEKFALRVGDVLVCEGGEPGRAAVWKDQLPGALYQKALHRVRFTDGAVDPNFFVYQLELLAATGDLARGFTGSTIKHLPRESFIELPLRVAPIAEQRRIVAAIEEDLSALDAAMAGLARARANVGRLRVSVVDQAVSCSADSGWPRVTAGELCEWASGDYLPQKSFSPGVIPVYGGNGVSGTHSVANVHSPTVIIGRVGAHCGNAYLSNGPAWVTDNAIFAKRVRETVTLPYLTLVMNAARLNMRAAGSGQPFVNQRMLNETEFVLPPVVIQNELVERTERALSLAARLAADIEVQLARAARLRVSILQRAFFGDLVPQYPADELVFVASEPSRTKPSPALGSPPPARGRARTGRAGLRRE